MSDTAKLRQLRPNLTYTPLGSFCEVDEDGNALPAFDAQNALIEMKALAARKATIEEATVSHEEPSHADSYDVEPEVEVAANEILQTPDDEIASKDALEIEPDIETQVEPEIEPDSETQVESEIEPVIEAQVDSDNFLDVEAYDISEPLAGEALADEADEVDEGIVEEATTEQVELESSVLATENEDVDVDELEVEQFFEELEFDELDDGSSNERPLTDYTVDELLSFDESDSDEPGSHSENDAPNEIEDVSIMTDTTVEEILSTPEDLVETDMEVSSESIQEESQELAAEPESNTQTENDVETSFFEEPSREVVIPKEKQGFFARLFKNS